MSLWKNGLVYSVGDIVTFNDIIYKCIENHTSFPAYGTPIQTKEILWSNDPNVVHCTQPVTLWRPCKAYVPGDIVKFAFQLYTCVGYHIGHVMLTPPHTRGRLWKSLDLETGKL